MATLKDERSRARSEDETKLSNVEEGRLEVGAGKQARVRGWQGIIHLLEKRGDVELRGCTPVPYDQRNETNYFNIFTLWFCVSCNPLPYVHSRARDICGDRIFRS